MNPPVIVVGVLALQGAFYEHIKLLRQAAESLRQSYNDNDDESSRRQLAPEFKFVEVRTRDELDRCGALIIPGGESTSMALVAARTGLLEPLREFVKVKRKPTWGTCAGLILLAESANRTKQGGQDLIGGLDVRVNRNHFGRQVESFQAPLHLPFLTDDSSSTKGTTDHQRTQQAGVTDHRGNQHHHQPFPGIFIRAPVVEKLLPTVVDGVQTAEQARGDTVVAPSRTTEDEDVKRSIAQGVEVLGVLPGRSARLQGHIEQQQEEDGWDAGDIVAVRQGNVFGTSFHPELTTDMRIHLWWLSRVVEMSGSAGGV